MILCDYCDEELTVAIGSEMGGNYYAHKSGKVTRHKPRPRHWSELARMGDVVIRGIIGTSAGVYL